MICCKGTTPHVCPFSAVMCGDYALCNCCDECEDSCLHILGVILEDLSLQETEEEIEMDKKVTNETKKGETK